jgi:hypothetical protein
MSYTYEIYHDQMDDLMDSPREWDQLGTMVCFHRRYTLGDKHPFRDPESAKEFLHEDAELIVSLPLYLMDHSGISMSTNAQDFAQWDPQGWDWGQLGFIYVEKTRAMHERQATEWTTELEAQVKDRLRSEVHEYDLYLRGECYGFTILDENGEAVDSCGGILGYDFAEQSAKEAVLDLENGGGEL